METRFIPPEIRDTVLIVVDLPVPPSVNSIWCHGRGRTWLDPKYQTWKRQADAEFMAAGAMRGKQKISGVFSADISIDVQHVRKNSDLDNKIKAVLDWAQRAEIIENDKNCIRVTAHYGEAPKGCRLTIEPTERVAV